MKHFMLRDWLVAFVAAALMTAGIVLAADYASAAPGKDKVKAQIKNGTLFVAGTAAGEEIVLRLQAGDPAMLEVATPEGLAGHNLRRDRFESIVLEAGEGNDLVRIDETNGAFTSTEATSLDGEGGNDDLRGGSGIESFRGGPGNDSIDGNQGNDSGVLGAGDDSFTWDPGDGSDTVEGQAGLDTLVFNGSSGGEIFDVSANGQRLRFFRNLGNIVMDVDDTERVVVRALGGADSTTVNDLSATDVDEVSVDLASSIGGTAGDGAADTVTIVGTDGVDAIDVFAAVGGEVQVTGLAAAVRISHSEPALDQLVLNTLAGVDQATVGAGVAALIGVTVNQ